MRRGDSDADPKGHSYVQKSIHYKLPCVGASHCATLTCIELQNPFSTHHPSYWCHFDLQISQIYKAYACISLLLPALPLSCSQLPKKNKLMLASLRLLP